MTLGRILRAVGISVLVALAGLVLVGLAPFALREKWTSGSVADTAAPLLGQVQVATDGLRRHGYSCADAITTPHTVTRSCSHVRGVTTSQVQLVAAAETGFIQLVRTTIDQGLTRAETHRQVLNVVGQALGLPAVDQAQVVAAAGAGEDAVLNLTWGTATIGTGDAADSTLRAAGSPGPGLKPSPATLALPVDALAAAAEAHGYTCMTPQVQTIRSCGRSDGGYGDDLWLQGADAYTTSVHLSVTSTLHIRTRSHWVQTMTETLGWVDTQQTRDLQAWLSASADAPGADSYVDGLRVSFLVRHGEWTKETFGGISTECAPTVDDISACDP
ncbi:hypothetical protein [uncultured Friedmanniella sp.]|uniref:hypothetical protein n=1 Tax=uncultured Friedmanniella sp. TaxID=335381 RepID=UPI0035CC7E09